MINRLEYCGISTSNKSCSYSFRRLSPFAACIVHAKQARVDQDQVMMTYKPA
jgi:hypothetical protein